MDILHIEWDTGYMDIDLERFFPCSVDRFKRLLKVIREDWKHCDEIREDLKNYFQNQIPELEAEKKAAAQRYSEAKWRRDDMQRVVTERKYASGVRLNKVQLDKAREQLNGYKKSVATNLSIFKLCSRNIESFKRLLNILEA